MTIRKLLATAFFVPLLVGIILLKVEYSFFTGSASSSKSLVNEANEIVNSLESEEEIRKEPSIERDVEDLQILYDTASKIYGSSERNAEFIRLIELSLSENKPGFAFFVAQDIYGSSERNEQYAKIIDKSLDLERSALAIKIAERIYGSTERNKAYRKIIKAGIKKRERGAPKKQKPPLT